MITIAANRAALRYHPFNLLNIAANCRLNFLLPSTTLLRFDASIYNRLANCDIPISALSACINSSNFQFWFSCSSEREFKAIIADRIVRSFAAISNDRR